MKKINKTYHLEEKNIQKIDDLSEKLGINKSKILNLMIDMFNNNNIRSEKDFYIKKIKK